MKELDIQLNIDKEDFKKKLGVKDGYTPVKGKDYNDGKDGSPDTPEEIVKKLSSLEGDKRLSYETLKDLPNLTAFRRGDISIADESDPIFNAWLLDTPPAYASDLTDYLYLPGREGGQTINDDITITGSLTTGLDFTATDGSVAFNVSNFEIPGLGNLPMLSYTSPGFAGGETVGGMFDGLVIARKNQAPQLTFIDLDNGWTQSIKMSDVSNTLLFSEAESYSFEGYLMGDTDDLSDLQIYSNPNKNGYIRFGDTVRIYEPYGQYQSDLDPIVEEFDDEPNAPLYLLTDRDDYYSANITNLSEGEYAESGWLVGNSDYDNYGYFGSLGVNNTAYGTYEPGAVFIEANSSNLYINALGMTSTTGNIYIASGGNDSKDYIRAVFTYDGKFGIGTTEPDFPLQVVGRARFNDSVGIDTDPTTLGLDLKGSLNFVGVTEPDSALTAILAGAGAGNVNNGTHNYKVSYYTSSGETALSTYFDTVTVTDNSTDGQVSLTDIPVSTDNKVVGRKIYRTKANTSSGYYLLATIANNTATTYTDNIADASLVAPTYDFRDNSTRGRIYLDSVVAGFFGDTNFSIGKNSMGNGSIIAGYRNIAFGTNALRNVSSGYQNSAFGYNTLSFNTTGYNNTAIGYQALLYNQTGYDNFALGTSAMRDNISGYNNVSLGSYTLVENETGNFNTAIGYAALKENLASNNVALGFYSLSANTSGTSNTGIGGCTLGKNTTGLANTALGFGTLYNNVAGSFNVGFGSDSLYYNNADNNVGLGPNSLHQNISGTGNLGVGFAAGYYALGSNNIFIGRFAGPPNGSGNISNKLYINIGISDTPLIYGEFDNDYVKINGDFEVSNRVIRSTSVYTGTDTIDDVYLNRCNSATDFTLTVTDGTSDGEEMVIKNINTGVVTLSGNINSDFAPTTLYYTEEWTYRWNSSVSEWQ